MTFDPKLIVFDMDGVLVDVHASYRETIRATVEHFTGVDVGHELIQDFKNQGGWNNDWALSHRLILDHGAKPEYTEVVDVFQRLFLGDGTTPGLISKERWIPNDGLLERLSTRRKLAIFTGRLRDEAYLTLNNYGAAAYFEPVIGDDNVTTPKPFPEGLMKAMDHHQTRETIYLGDTLDDARAASAAQVPFLGIVSRSMQDREKVAGLLREAGALVILEDINQLEQYLA